LNDLVATGLTTGKVVVHGDGKPWRPVIHVQDVAAAFIAALQAPIEKVHNQAFNTGANELNYQIGELARIVTQAVPDCVLELQSQSGADQRTYKADFSKFARTFPDFKFRWNAETGAKNLYEEFKAIGLTYSDLTDKRFTRLRWLRHLMETEQLDGALYWREPATGTGVASAGVLP
jgi:nucleoside-diphosphate-sugar epimerase